MHDLDATRIFWKEWRAQRSFWLGLFGLAIALEVLLIYVSPLLRPMKSYDQFRFHETLVVVLACSFAAGSAAIAFAGEVEAKTKGLLQRVPLRARDLLAGKWTLSLAGSYSLFLALWLVGGFLLARSQSMIAAEAFSYEMPVFWQNLPGPLLFVVVCSLFSLILSNVLLTAVIAGVSTAVLLAIPAVRDNLPLQGALIGAAIGVDFLLARRWLVKAEAVDWHFSPTISITLPLVGRRRSVLDESGALESVRSAVAWRRAVSSLMWKEFRQALPFCAAILVAGFLAKGFYAATTGPLVSNGVPILPWMMIAVVAPLLLGIAAISVDRRGEGVGLLANCGLRPRWFLISKHVAWLSLSLFAFGLFLILDRAFAGFEAAPGRADPLWNAASEAAHQTLGTSETSLIAPFAAAAFCVLLSYSLGYLLTLLLSGPLMAFFVGVLLLFVIEWARAGAAFLRIPFWWTFGVLPFIFLAVASLRSADWLSRRNSFASRGKAAALLVASLIGILAGVVVFRVTQIPAASVPKAVLEFAPSPTPVQPARGSGTWSKFDDALFQTCFSPRGFDSNEVVGEKGWEFATRQERNWVKEHEGARKLAIEATHREPRPFPKPTWGDADNPYRRFTQWRDMGWLTELLLYSARRYEAQDKLDEALECYVAVARLSQDAARSGQVAPFDSGDGLALWALDWMQRWAAHSKQSTNRVKQAIDQFAAFQLQPADVPKSVASDWEINRRALRKALWKHLSVPGTEPKESEEWWVRWLLPWELVRLERLTDAVFAADLKEADSIRADLQKQGFVTMTPERTARLSDSRLRQFQPTTLPAPEWLHLPYWGPWYQVDRLALERMQLIALALADFKREHHRLPDSLHSLVPTYFQHLPVDPWAGGDFNYEPKGLPHQISLSEGELERHTPFLASAGMLDNQLVRRFAPASRTPSSEAVNPFDPKKAGDGWIFPAPIVRLARP
jgi:hypothetical protein